MADVKLRTDRHPSDDKPPTHLIVRSGARFAMCGEKDTLPHVLADRAQAHAIGYNPLFCADCVAAL